MFPVVLLSTLAFARDVASLVIVEAPLPPTVARIPVADETFRPVGVIASCGVTWTVPTAGTPDAAVDADCPDEHRAAVERAALAWSFGAVEPLKGQQVVSVRRWMVLEDDGSALTWGLHYRSPTAALPAEECVKLVSRVAPRFPSYFEGDRAQCSVWMQLDEGGRPTQLEVSACANGASFAVLEATEAWTFKVCQDLPADQRTYKTEIKYRRQ